MNYNSGAYTQAVNYLSIFLGNYNSGAYAARTAYTNADLTTLKSKAVDIYIDQGDEYVHVVTITDDQGNRVNVTGAEVTFNLLRFANAGHKFTTNALVVDNKIVLNIPQSVTSGLVNSRYVYDVMINLNGVSTKVLHGSALITNR